MDDWEGPAHAHRAGSEPGDSELEQWARLESKSTETEQELRGRFASPSCQRVKAVAILLTVFALFALGLIRSCAPAPDKPRVRLVRLIG